eukprot:snap_masked-scaffold_9-processed-gene-11.22-mRNA-1 protein AED:0.43 eAED:1.00 QI:0/0/0/1/1/1/2/0/63
MSKALLLTQTFAIAFLVFLSEVLTIFVTTDPESYGNILTQNETKTGQFSTARDFCDSTGCFYK